MDEIIPFLKRENADVVALTEVFDGHNSDWEARYRSMDVLREALGYPHEAFAQTFCEVEDFGEVNQGNAVLSKFPIQSQDIIALEPYAKRDARVAHQQYFSASGDEQAMAQVFMNTPRNIQHVQIDIRGNTLNLLNTQGPWGMDGLDDDRRLAMGRAIGERVSALKNVVVCGDFNVQENTQSIALIEQQLKNVFKGELTTSFNMEQKKTHRFAAGFATSVVDMLFVSPDLSIVEKAVYPDNVSDHLSMSVTVNI